MTKRILSILMACMIAVTIAGCGGNNKDTAKNNTTSAQTEQKKEQPQQDVKPAEAPKPTPTLHVNPTDFQIRFNNYMHNDGGELGATGMFDIGEPVVKKGNGQDVVQYVNNDLNLIIQQHIDPISGEIKEVFITSTIAGKDGQTIQASLLAAVMVHVATIKSVDPSADAAAIQEALGMTQSPDKWIADTATSSNGIKYYKKVVKGVGLAFGASSE